MKYEIVPVTPFQQNCSILWCEKTGKAAIVDPGGEAGKILARVDALGVDVDKVLLTHGHLDHAGAANAIKNMLNVPIVGPQQEEAFWLNQIENQASMFGFGEAENVVPDVWLNDSDIVKIGETQLLVLHTPGHTPGHVVFYCESSKLAIVGDVLFAGSIGRSDFPRGNHAQLIRSIREKLLGLGDDICFIPGHGPMSTFGQERLTNPFVADRNFG
ncbi:MBL fold metallo-hydrolase [Gynuella sunshinyii]|uniref:Zn-dependent hydrolase, including glyoxylase n=1 Tax=Gynuella sunshinyii YC6258 TaxID=1445510 RepID=A0A0C5V7C6_9GAMM|nr:MBL fold metallo-hydrolase [Gynuella sunshinyii]AJQ95310.1 Zn-dependent hydrolase, including glyoxylase [Gynuella sunshinyii YC6258]